MPTRSSRPAASSAGNKRAIAYHAAMITALWVVVLFMCLGVWLVLLVNMLRLDAVEKRLTSLEHQLSNNQVLNVLAPMIPTTPLGALPSAGATTTPPAGSPTNTAPTPTPTPTAGATTSPSGALDRGSLSPDGTKFAGYNDTVKGKIGIAVELVSTGKVKYIVLFSPFSESTGKGTPQEGNLSVRWKDNSTIEYDELVKQGSDWVKQTNTVKIYF